MAKVSFSFIALFCRLLALFSLLFAVRGVYARRQRGDRTQLATLRATRRRNARHSSSCSPSSEQLPRLYLCAESADCDNDLRALPLIAYIGLGERARHTHHLLRAELKLKLGEDVRTSDGRIY